MPLFDKKLLKCKKNNHRACYCLFHLHTPHILFGYNLFIPIRIPCQSIDLSNPSFFYCLIFIIFWRAVIAATLTLVLGEPLHLRLSVFLLLSTSVSSQVLLPLFACWSERFSVWSSRSSINWLTVSSIFCYNFDSCLFFVSAFNRSMIGSASTATHAHCWLVRLRLLLVLSVYSNASWFVPVNSLVVGITPAFCVAMYLF